MTEDTDIAIETDDEPVDDDMVPGDEIAKRRMAQIALIRLHYETHGAKDWKLVREKLPDIPDRQFWRLVAKVKSGVPDTEILKSTIAFARAAARRAIPAPASPAIIYSDPITVRGNIDFMAHMKEMLDDIDKLRDYSLGPPNADGGRPIRNPMYFLASVKERGVILDRALKAYESVWDLRKQMDFYDAIIKEVSEADPETAKRIMDRLNLLNNERGLTINARIGGNGGD